MQNLTSVLTNLNALQKEIIEAKIKKRDTFVEFLKSQGFIELADRVQEYGIPVSIIVPDHRIHDLSYLAAICPVYGKKWGWGESTNEMVFSWVGAGDIARQKEIPLLHRVCLVPIERFLI